MTQDNCEHEPLVVAATRSGNWPADLEHHVAACASCAETKRVAQLFLDHATAAAAHSGPPASSIVWRGIQAKRQQLAIKRATQCVTIMSVLAAVYALVLATWYLPQLCHVQLATDLGPLLSGVTLKGVVTALFAVLIGSCCFAFLGSRTSFKLRT